MKIFFGQQFIQNRINNRNEKHFKQRPISFCAASGEDGFQKPNLKYVDNFLLYENRGATGLSSEIIQFLKRNYACMALLNEALHNLRRLEKGEVDFKAIKELAMINYSPETREDLDGFLEKCGITSNEKLIEVATALEILEKRNIDGARKPSEIIKLCVDPRIPKEIFLAYPNLLIEASFGNELYEEQIDCAKMAEFIKELNIDNEDVFFDKHFSHLAPDFNDFKTVDDRLLAFESIMATYPIKKEHLEAIKGAYGYFGTGINIDEFYANNAAVIDYIYENIGQDTARKLALVMQYACLLSPIAPHAINAVSDVIDAKTPQGKIQLYEFLEDEMIEVDEFNKLTRQTYYEGLSSFDVLSSRSDYIKEMINFYNIPSFIAVNHYTNFGHTINAAKNSNIDFHIDPALLLARNMTKIGATNDGEFLDFYLKLTKGNIKPQKNKKGQQKTSQNDIAKFVDLLCFLDDEMILKHKTDKKFSLYGALKDKKAEFEKAKDKIEKAIDKNNARKYYPDAFCLFVESYGLFKSTKNLDTFVLKAIESEKARFKESPYLEERFFYYFGDVDSSVEFLVKNKIRLDKEDAHTKLCLKLLECLAEGKTDEESHELSQKLLESDFLVNSKKALTKFFASKSDKEIQTLLEIILNEGMSSVNEIEAMIKPYLNSKNEIGKLLVHFRGQNLDFRSYMERLSQIKNSLNNYGFSVCLNNDNINFLTPDDLNGGKLNLKQACELAKRILNPNDGNFICGMKNSIIEQHMPYSNGAIAKELISSQTGRYNESYNGFLVKFHLEPGDLACYSAADSKYRERLVDSLKNKSSLKDLLNFNAYLNIFEDGKIPNLSLHARMRMIDRFILQEDKNPFSNESIEIMKDVLRRVYFTIPNRMEKAKNGFVAYFPYNENAEIKVVFDNDGQMLTIIKSKL